MSIFGDTKPCKNEFYVAKNADVMVHEATYIEGDKTLANNYHHSHIEDVFDLIERANVKRSLITHLSNRYNHDVIDSIKDDLQSKDQTPNFEFVKDFDTFKI